MIKPPLLCIAVPILIFAVHTANAQPIPGLVAHWKLDGSADDVVGGINGAANGVTWVQALVNGQQKTVASFDGTGSIALTGELTALKLGQNFSVSVWVNVRDWGFTGGNTYYGIFCAGQPMVSWPDNWPEAAYGFQINPDRNLAVANGRFDYPNFTLAASYTTQTISSPGDFSNESLDLGISTDSWRMLTWTYDGVEFRSYLDTTLLTVFHSGYGYGNHFTGWVGTTNNISPYTDFTTAWIGRSTNEKQAGQADAPVQNFKGLMSNLRVYNRTLSAAEVGSLFQADSVASANLIVNGSFEAPVITGPWVRFISPSNEIPGWSVTSGEIDISRGEWIAHHGEQSVDLVGLGVMGEVGQIVPTEPGAAYQLSFHYGNNPGPVPPSAAVRVSENGGGLIKELVVTHSGSELSNMKWPRATVEFVASSSSTRISFTALSKHGDGGICIDSVELTKSEGVPDTDNDGVNNYREDKDGTDPNDPNSFNPLSKGLVAYYPFEGDADDESGYGDRLNLAGGSLSQDRFQDAQAALLAESSVGPVAESTKVMSIEGNAERTISFWVQMDASSSESSVSAGWGNASSPGNASLLSAYGTGAVNFWGHHADLDKAPEPNFVGFWRHVTFVYSGSLGAAQVYVDGQERLLIPGGLNLRGDLDTMPTTLKIAGWGFTAAQPGASIDDVRIYNRALSPTEVGQLYQTEAGDLDSDGDGLTDAWERGYGRYQIVEGNFTWDQAKADAEAKGGHLATFTSPAEWHFFIEAYAPSFANGLRIGYEAQEDSLTGWAWVTEESGAFTFWDAGQPNGGEGSVVMYNAPLGFVWHDYVKSVDVFGYLLEFGYPTDPFKADTDGDGYDDKVESDAGTDPNNPASKPVPPDTDGDGIRDAYETNTGVYISPTDTGTDPNNPDSDGDTLPDGVETASYIYIDATDTGTDPNLPDTDGDGLSDNVETNTGTYASATNTGTNPLLDDTSGDGITDGEAVAAQFNPLIDQRPVLNFLTQAVAAQPNRFGFYNEANVMHLGMGGLMIRKSGSAVNIDLQWQTKTSLTDAWTNHGAPLPFFLNLPGSKAFIRLQATPGAP